MSAASWANAAFKTRALVQQGTLTEMPAWVDIIQRFGVHEPKKGKAPKQILFYEDRLYQAYMAKHPQFLQEPLDLNSEKPPAMKLFVMAQSALMQQGVGRKAAFKMVEEEFKRSAPSAALSAGQLTLAAAQRLEEQTLQKALRLRRDEVGPPAGLATPSQDLMSAPTFSFRLPPRPQAADQSQGSPQTEAGPSTTADQPGTAAVSEQQAGQNQKGSGRVLQWRAQTLQHDSTSPDNEEGHTAPPGFVAFGSSKS